MDWAKRAALQITYGDLDQAKRAANIICVWRRRKDRLPNAQFGKSLSDLFDQAGLDFDGEGRDKVVVGIDWREKLPAVLN
jgi:hypothetical protein